jgi:hypothetical protein
MKNEEEKSVNHWDSYMDDPFFYEQSHDVEERTEDDAERMENNVPPAMPMPAPSYPVLPVQEYPMENWHHPMAGGMTSFVDNDEFDNPDVAPPMMTFDMGEREPMGENVEFTGAAPMMQMPSAAEMQGGVSGAGSPVLPPTLPMAWMVPSVPLPACSPMMPFGAPMPTVYYTPMPYYGGMAPYVPLLPGSYW